MGAYVINGASGYDAIPVSDFGEEQPSYSSIALLGIPVEAGTATDPVTLWKGHGGQIDCSVIGGNLYEYIVQRMTGSTISGTVYDSSPQDDTLNVYIGAYSFMSGSTKMLRVFYCVAHTESDVINRLVNQGLGDTNTLYQNTFAAAEESLFDYAPNWDDTPDTSDGDDPERIGPQGGEYADRDPFGQTTDIDLPGVPDEVILSDFITIYSLDGADIAAIGTAIFTDNTWANFQNKFIGGIGDPISYIISAVEVPVGRTVDGTKKFNLGGVNVSTANGTEITVPYAQFRYKTLDFGAITLKEVWGSEKDYSQTSIAIYLPYVGVHDLDTAQLMNAEIHLKGCLDITNGDLMYALVVSKKNRPGVYVESKGITYRFQGNCARQIPIGKVDSTTQLLAMTGAIASMGIGLESGMPFGAGGYNPSKELWASGDYEANVNTRAIAGGGAGILGATAMGPKVSMSAGLSGAIGRADVQRPYLIITQNVPIYPNNWRTHFGAPRYQTFTVGDLHGYTQFADYHAEQIEGANDAERAAIEQAMKAGVFLP